MGSALMLMLWLVLMERLELPDLQTDREREGVKGRDCGGKVPPSGQTNRGPLDNTEINPLVEYKCT